MSLFDTFIIFEGVFHIKCCLYSQFDSLIVYVFDASAAEGGVPTESRVLILKQFFR